MQKSAFSLVELAIVLVILGLLTGGILAGRALIYASELRSVSTDLIKYKTAATAFRDKYLALPGDMPNATSFWGIAAGNGQDEDCRVAIAAGTETCNGNGNGRINRGGGPERGEYYRFWQHLSNAGLLEGKYTGATSDPSASFADVPGTNIPLTKFQNIAIALRGDNYVSSLTHANRFLLSRCCHGSGYIEVRAFIPGDAYNLDTKMDDGIPGSGKFQSWGPGGYWSGCATGSGGNSEYELSTNNRMCNLFYDLGL